MEEKQDLLERYHSLGFKSLKNKACKSLKHLGTSVSFQLRSGNMGNIFLQLVSQYCCIAS